MAKACIESPFGRLCLTEENEKITRLDWQGETSGASLLLNEACAQLSAYFTGDLTHFDLPLKVHGTDFQRAVCTEMSKIPYGEIVTYGDIAKTLGVAAQPVGRACGANPIPILIPCHRVMGAGGKLTGFSGAGGVETKVALLRLERAAGLLI